MKLRITEPDSGKHAELSVSEGEPVASVARRAAGAFNRNEKSLLWCLYKSNGEVLQQTMPIGTLGLNEGDELELRCVGMRVPS